jgi:hypothetical protein
MSELTRQELITAVDALFPTNNNESISASNARSAFRNFIESTYNKADDNINNNASVPEWSNSISYPLNFIINFNDKFWRSKENDNINHVPAENAYWTEVSKATAGQNIDLSHYYLKQELQTAGEAEVALENIVELESELAAKANSTHNHNIVDINNLQNALNTKSDALSIGRILFVSKNGNNTTALIGRKDKPFLTIQAAFNAASNLDVIYIITGTYTENISCNVVLRGIILDNCTINGTINLTPNNNIGFNKTIIQGIGQSKIISTSLTLSASLSFYTFEFKNLEINATYTDNDLRTVVYYDCILNKTADYASSTHFIRCYNCTITAESKTRNLYLHKYFNCDVTFEGGVIFSFSSESILYFRNCENINFGDFLFSQNAPLKILDAMNCEITVGRFRNMNGYGNYSPQIFRLRNCKITETNNPTPYIFTHDFVAGDWYLGGGVLFEVNFCTSNKEIYDISKPINVTNKINYLVIE